MNLSPIAWRDASARSPSAPDAGPEKPQFAYIDCLRGYAVLMVIACHTAYSVPELPYPVHRLGTFGWFGVQLFFLVSCVTLMMSANHERARTGRLNAGAFFIRRFLRIAPMYYLAAAFYWTLMPNAAADISRLVATLLFVNAWHPVTGTTTGEVVRGGWSIGVEFTFYFLFPAFAAFVISLRRAALLLAATLLAGAALNSILLAPLSAEFGATTADNFLFFWFPNQAPVFVLGAMTYMAIIGMQRAPDSRAARLFRRHPGKFQALALALLLAAAMAPLRFTHELMLLPAVPQYLAASLAFMLLIVALAQAAPSLLKNPLIASVGKVSFSAYLLHFVVIDLVLEAHPDLFRLEVTGWTAIGAYGVAVAAVALITYLGSLCTYTLVEEPMMKLAKRITRARQAAAATS